mgnify:CR=1 FL=1
MWYFCKYKDVFGFPKTQLNDQWSQFESMIELLNIEH